jgi:hypothetical protein
MLRLTIEGKEKIKKMLETQSTIKVAFKLADFILYKKHKIKASNLFPSLLLHTYINNIDKSLKKGDFDEAVKIANKIPYGYLHEND